MAVSWESKGNPPMPPLRPYLGTIMVNDPLIRWAISWGKTVDFFSGWACQIFMILQDGYTPAKQT